MNKMLIPSISHTDMLKVLACSVPMWQSSIAYSQICNHTLFIGDEVWSLALNIEAYGLSEEGYKHMASFPVPIIFSARYKAVRHCTMLVDDIRAQVLNIIRSMKDVDMAKFPHAYPLQLDRCKSVVLIEGKAVLISSIEHATRLMLLAGMNAVDIDIEDRLISFVGRHKGVAVAAVTIATFSQPEDEKYRYAVLGKISMHPVKAECNEVDASLIHSTSMAVFNASELIEKERMGMYNIYSVELAKNHTAYVLANDEREAGEIARDNVSNDEFSDFCQVKDVNVIEYADIEGTDCEVYTPNDTISVSDLLRYGFDKNNQDEDEDV